MAEGRGAGPVRTAVLGAGLIGRRHIAHVAREAELCAIVDPSPGAAQIAGQYGTSIYTDLADLLKTDRPDAVIVATPNQMHVAHGLACVDAGVPALIEKPIAADVASAERLVGRAEAAGVPLLVGHHRRYNGLVRAARDLIGKGRLGRLVAVQASCWFYKPDDYFEMDWRRQPGAGPVFLNLIHDIDLLRFVCGEVAWVQASEANTIRGFPVEDTAALILGFENGALGTVTASDTVAAPWSWEMTAGENPDYPRSGEASYHIGGTEGALSLPNLELWHYGREKNWWAPIERETAPFDREDPFAVQTRHFCDVVRGRATPLVSGREGLETLRVIEAIKQAASTGRRVEVRAGGPAMQA
jgi:predicted dehydrogenase